jgi:hypothetical protein
MALKHDYALRCMPLPLRQSDYSSWMEDKNNHILLNLDNSQNAVMLKIEADGKNFDKTIRIRRIS